MMRERPLDVRKKKPKRRYKIDVSRTYIVAIVVILLYTRCLFFVLYRKPIYYKKCERWRGGEGERNAGRIFHSRVLYAGRL